MSMIQNDQGTGSFPKAHAVEEGDIIRDSWWTVSRVTAVYSNGWDTEVVSNWWRVWCFLTRRELC